MHAKPHQGSSQSEQRPGFVQQPMSDCSSLDGSVFADGCHTTGQPKARRSQTSESITSSNFNYSLNRRFISKNQMKEFREAFRLFDKDNNGSITKEELGTVMRSLGQFARVEELQEMLLEIDVDGDGNVSFEEFVDIMSNMTDTVAEASADQEERELRDAFRVFDKHNRGYITASDLRAVLQCLGEDLDEEEIEDMIKEVDVDGDGRIDFYEFVHALGEPEDSQENDDEEEVMSLRSLSCDVNA
ncbi:neo-calmodulin isoform X2 [Malaya genurostris]|nr:neo-calmodulin isoform X2 [Malaya genurostris]